MTRYVWYVPLDLLIYWQIAKVVAALIFIVEVLLFFAPGQRHILQPQGEEIAFHPILGTPGAWFLAAWLTKITRSIIGLIRWVRGRFQ
jgi:hypothetical protein